MAQVFAHVGGALGPVRRSTSVLGVRGIVVLVVLNLNCTLVE